MTTNEPDRLPQGCDNWNEWRERHAAYRDAFIAREIDETRARAVLATMNFYPGILEPELEEWKEARRAALPPYQQGKL